MYLLLASLMIMSPFNVLHGGPYNNYIIKNTSTHLVIPRIVPYSPDQNQGTPTDDSGNTVVDDIYHKTDTFDKKGLRIYKFSHTEIR